MARILLIDDDNDYRNMVKMWLEKEGHEVAEAKDTESWVTLYTQNHYDLVITDLFMPQIDGVQAIRMIKKEFNSPKIIAMTGGSSDGTLEYLLNLAKECGANDIYKKTSPIDELLTKVRNLL
ncbi:MAG: response regulator [Lentisphaerota bacterium]